jgi:photosystem II stability/assembly factor-like uncharacterized protein
MKYARVSFGSSRLKYHPTGFRKAAFISGISCQLNPSGAGGRSVEKRDETKIKQHRNSLTTLIGWFLVRT